MSIPYIGSRISLISKSEIRYEGTLYTINTQESTVALQNGNLSSCHIDKSYIAKIKIPSHIPLFFPSSIFRNWRTTPWWPTDSALCRNLWIHNFQVSLLCSMIASCRIMWIFNHVLIMVLLDDFVKFIWNLHDFGLLFPLQFFFPVKLTVDHSQLRGSDIKDLHVLDSAPTFSEPQVASLPAASTQYQYGNPAAPGCQYAHLNRFES